MLASLGSGPVLYGGLFFAIVAAVGIAVFIWQVDPLGWQQEPWAAFADATREIVDSENADAIAFIPYSDGPLIPKPAIYDREILGGTGGYRTEDGEIIYVDGEGSGKFELEGVPVILAIDPTEHASGVDPLKAWIWHQADKAGEWLKIDSRANVIEAAEALDPLPDEDGETPTPRMDMDADQPLNADGNPLSTDGGEPMTEVDRLAAESGLSIGDAKKRLESDGVLQKIVDIAPPKEAVVDEETGELNVEEADHVAVNVSEAANMLPKKTNTTELQVAMEKAKAEGRDEEKLMEYFIYGGAAGALGATIVAVVMALVMGFL